MNTAALSLQGFSLSLGARAVLSDVSFSTYTGEIVGILGPNGSGKTSLMRCITGLQSAAQGTLSVDGQALSQHSRSLRARMGVVFQEPSLDDKLSALDNLVLGAALFGVKKSEAKSRASELLAFMDLEDRRDDLVRTLSGGMRRRLELARALIHQPKVLLLDEPTTGLDPYAFERTWQRLFALRSTQQLTVVLSTHRADEAERCDRLVVLDRGRVVACDTPHNLLASVSGDIIALDDDDADGLVQAIKSQFDVPCQRVGDSVLLEIHDAHAFVPRLMQALPQRRIHALTVRRPSLADAFFKLTGRSLSTNDHA